MASLDAGKYLAFRYVLQERLGDGGHAEVWSALDEHTGRRVALKFLHASNAGSDDELRALGHEAQMARRLDHPGVLHVGKPQCDGAIVFLPMEYASGGSIAKLRGAPWQQVLPVLLEVASVLEHAHSRGVVHRDIKPGNVLFDEQGAVRVADFSAASRTGSSAALAAGSPFSASPQQLRDEAATTADDVYGLGALAYELLGRYPPYYPEFDARYVQEEDPARLVPVHPAPPELVDFIMSMLARVSGNRPDLQQVMQAFEHCIAVAPPVKQSVGEGLIEVAPAPVEPVVVAPVRRRLAPLLWLAGAAGVAAVAFVLLPGTRPQLNSVVAKPVVNAPRSVADALVHEPAAPVAPALVVAPASQLAGELAAGDAALAAVQPALARAAFQRALALERSNDEAQRGLRTAATQQRALETYATGTRDEAGGRFAQAAQAYAVVLQGLPDFAPARLALARVQERMRLQRLDGLLADGAAALLSGRITAAQAAYTEAAKFRADDPRVQDGFARVAEVQRSQRNADDLAAGAALERSETWAEAVAHYQAVGARDASLRFAQDGLARSLRRAELDAELQDYLARPERLTAAQVRAAAERAVARGEAALPQAPRLTEQLASVKSLLRSLQAQVRLAITSDNNTQVSVTQVGDLGAFMTRELNLPPGHYTAIGRREGFRDVRREITIEPGQREATVSVQCTERIETVSSRS